MRQAAGQTETLDDEWQSDSWMLTAQGHLGYFYDTM
jgi:hypothetical protein